MNAQAFMGGFVGRPSFAYFSWPARKVGRLPGATGKTFCFKGIASLADGPQPLVIIQQEKTKGLRPLATPYSFCTPEKE